MTPDPDTICTAFAGTERLEGGVLSQVAAAVKRSVDAGESRTILILEDASSEVIEIDLRGSVDDVVERLDLPIDPAPEPPRAPGRPRLGVVGREVTLLPRHWEWLSAQPGGASVALRKLVEQARKANASADEGRRAQESAYRFMSAIAGDEPGYEEALRALYADDAEKFTMSIAAWPEDVREHAAMLAARAFEANAQGEYRG